MGGLGKRNKELDSLRGIAAISVLMYHTLAINFPFLQAGIGLAPVPGIANNLLVYSPLHVFWLGAEAVWMFFVLSGFVLTRVAAKESFSWDAYYPSRMVRLYLPVFAAVALAWVSFVVVAHVPTAADGDTLTGLATDYPLLSIVHDLTVVGGTSTSLGVLWSLQWEIIFSLSLPVYLFLVRRHGLAAGIIAGVACLLGWYINDPVTSFLPMFLLGALLAQYWSSIARAFSFLTTRSVRSFAAGVVLITVSILAMCSFYLLGRDISNAGWPPRVVTLPLALGGISLLLVLAQVWIPLRALLSSRVPVFLGTISFSLYLVHRPIAVALAFALHIGKTSAVLTVVVSLVVACLFYFAIERPAHHLSQRIASRVRARASSSDAVMRRAGS
ncbi:MULTISPECIES: acyltransferase [unclassified Cryobacterium]|uniref:acyltransferase family protein n=1 Tax=unclassified Cryobacterium TaxID=2649013 RepID=UPI002AB3728F|nr:MULTISPECIES: acyltransferase [unclassified Cryobacterium]MDY7526664.1 acyltransferase [Cryobacterium sp. 10C2]MDY7557531.1 acyltransferase [Cryobacterium sp. 10C3]MEB0292368.1 acyltransferase [Cryobacterium sp. 10C2]